MITASIRQLEVIASKNCARDAKLPSREPGATGYDLHACLDSDSNRKRTPSHRIAIEARIATSADPSASASRRGVMAAFGTIDADYPGDCRHLYALRIGSQSYTTDRIAIW